MTGFPSLPNLTGSGFKPSTGSGTAFGKVPGPIKVPPNQYQQVAGVVPSLPKLTDSTANTIQSELDGQLSTGTLNLLQDKAAQFGVNSGMPGLNGLSLQNLMQNIGLTSETLAQQGTKDYLSFLTGVGSTQTDPNLAAGIADRNATNAAAPDPRLAAEFQLGLLDKYLSRYGGGSPAAGRGAAGGTYTLPGTPGGKISPEFLPGPSSYGTNLIATTSGVFPAGTPVGTTNPGADYSTGIEGLYFNPFAGNIQDEPYSPMVE